MSRTNNNNSFSGSSNNGDGDDSMIIYYHNDPVIAWHKIIVEINTVVFHINNTSLVRNSRSAVTHTHAHHITVVYIYA